MRCILHGHRPVTEEGQGEYAGRVATICADCGIEFSNNRSEGLSAIATTPTLEFRNVEPFVMPKIVLTPRRRGAPPPRPER